MVTMTADKARADFSDVLSRAKYSGESTIVTKHGKEYAAVVPIEGFKLLLKIIREVEDEIDTTAARAALKEIEREGTESWESVKAELGL